MLAVYGPTLGFDTEQRNSFLIKFGVFFTIETRFWQYYSWLIMRKSHFNDEFLVLLGPIISRLLICSNVEKNKIKKQRVLALVLSLWRWHIHKWGIIKYEFVLCDMTCPQSKIWLCVVQNATRKYECQNSFTRMINDW